MVDGEILDDDWTGNSQEIFNPIILVLICILAGPIIGAITNFINAEISTKYFSLNMGWNEPMQFRIIMQGVTEGLLYGTIFGILFTLAFVSIFQNNGRWSFAKNQLSRAMLLIFIFWFLGGALAMLINWIAPLFLERIIYLYPLTPKERVPYVWVGGSIWGQISGAVVALILCIKNMSHFKG